MTAETNSQSNPEKTTGARDVGLRPRRALSLAVLLLFCVCALLVLLAGRRAAAITNGPSDKPSFGSTENALSKPPQDYSRFSHSSPGEHAGFTARSSCNGCHTRRNNSIEPTFPQHRDCINCHQTQFTTPNSPLCGICHQPEGLNQQNPPVKKFSSLRSFNTEFDHAQHTSGIAEAKSQGGCAACHGPARRGIAKASPAGLSAHQTCYQCHTPGRQAGGGDISSCGACHRPGRSGGTGTSGRSYRIGFSHADHGPRQNLSCENCHTVSRGLARGRQVSSTFPAQHFPNTRAQSCVTCHNGQRTFGENNFNDCKRCHAGATIRL